MAAATASNSRRRASRRSARSSPSARTTSARRASANRRSNRRRSRSSTASSCSSTVTVRAGAMRATPATLDVRNPASLASSCRTRRGPSRPTGSQPRPGRVVRRAGAPLGRRRDGGPRRARRTAPVRRRSRRPLSSAHGKDPHERGELVGRRVLDRVGNAGQEPRVPVDRDGDEGARSAIDEDVILRRRDPHGATRLSPPPTARR